MKSDIGLAGLESRGRQISNRNSAEVTEAIGLKFFLASRQEYFKMRMRSGALLLVPCLLFCLVFKVQQTSITSIA